MDYYSGGSNTCLLDGGMVNNGEMAMIIHKCDVCGAEIKEKGVSKFSYKTYLDYDLDLEGAQDFPIARFQTYELCQDCAYKIKDKIEKGEI